MNNTRRFIVLERDGFRCVYCGRPSSDGAILEVDHRHPKSQGGTDDLDNLITACRDCNRGKSARVLATFPLTFVPVIVGAQCPTPLRVATIGHQLGLRSYDAAHRYANEQLHVADLPPLRAIDRRWWKYVHDNDEPSRILLRIMDAAVRRAA